MVKVQSYLLESELAKEPELGHVSTTNHINIYWYFTAVVYEIVRRKKTEGDTLCFFLGCSRLEDHQFKKSKSIHQICLIIHS